MASINGFLGSSGYRLKSIVGNGMIPSATSLEDGGVSQRVYDSRGVGIAAGSSVTFSITAPADLKCVLNNLSTNNVQVVCQKIVIDGDVIIDETSGNNGVEIRVNNVEALSSGWVTQLLSTPFSTLEITFKNSDSSTAYNVFIGWSDVEKL